MISTLKSGLLHIANTRGFHLPVVHSARCFTPDGCLNAQKRNPWSIVLERYFFCFLMGVCLDIFLMWLKLFGILGTVYIYILLKNVFSKKTSNYTIIYINMYVYIILNHFLLSDFVFFWKGGSPGKNGSCPKKTSFRPSFAKGTRALS